MTWRLDGGRGKHTEQREILLGLTRPREGAWGQPQESGGMAGSKTTSSRRPPGLTSCLGLGGSMLFCHCNQAWLRMGLWSFLCLSSY